MPPWKTGMHNSYECRAYQSVDEKSPKGYVPKNDEKKHLDHKGLKKIKIPNYINP